MIPHQAALFTQHEGRQERTLARLFATSSRTSGAFWTKQTWTTAERRKAP
jgi:hypothetical protein